VLKHRVRSLEFDLEFERERQALLMAELQNAHHHELLLQAQLEAQDQRLREYENRGYIATIEPPRRPPSPPKYDVNPSELIRLNKQLSVDLQRRDQELDHAKRTPVRPCPMPSVDTRQSQWNTQTWGTSSRSIRVCVYVCVLGVPTGRLKELEEEVARLNDRLRTQDQVHQALQDEFNRYREGQRKGSTDTHASHRQLSDALRDLLKKHQHTLKLLDDQTKENEAMQRRNKALGPGGPMSPFVRLKNLVHSALYGFFKLRYRAEKKLRVSVDGEVRLAVTPQWQGVQVTGFRA
jgi:hypothetical protein